MTPYLTVDLWILSGSTVSVVESINFRALRVLSPSEVEMTFEGDDGTLVVHIFTMKPTGLRDASEGSFVVNGDAEFWRKYRCYARPEVRMSIWPERLAAAAQCLAMQSYPAGETQERLIEEARAAKQAAWDARRR
jgi:hypothetical protein